MFCYYYQTVTLKRYKENSRHPLIGSTRIQRNPCGFLRREVCNRPKIRSQPVFEPRTSTPSRDHRSISRANQQGASHKAGLPNTSTISTRIQTIKEYGKYEIDEMAHQKAFSYSPMTVMTIRSVLHI